MTRSSFHEDDLSAAPQPSAAAAVLLSARLPRAWLGSRARISPHLPKFPLTKCHDYTFLLLH